MCAHIIPLDGGVPAVSPGLGRGDLGARTRTQQRAHNSTHKGHVRCGLLSGKADCCVPILCFCAVFRMLSVDDASASLLWLSAAVVLRIWPVEHPIAWCMRVVLDLVLDVFTCGIRRQLYRFWSVGALLFKV
jgi:hypothetical protein